MSKKKETSNGKAVINVRKISGKEEWYLVLNINHLKGDDRSAMKKEEYLDMKITTPLFDKTAPPIRVFKDGTKQYSPIRDSRGVIICTSYEDQKKCNAAEKIRKERQKELDHIVFASPEEQKLIAQIKHSEDDFIAYFDDVIYRLHPKSSRNTLGNWKQTLGYLKEFNGRGPLPFKNLSMKFCNDFRSFVLSRPARRPGFEGTISQAAAATFFSIFKAALKQAFVEDYLRVNLGALAKGIKAPRAKREILDKDELRKLASTPCPNKWVKRAALFTAFTGLRHSDVKKIKWSQLIKTSSGWRLDLKQEKTTVPLYLPLSDQAYSLCGEPGNPADHVFAKCPEINNTNKIIHKWVAAAGIERRITYHCFRHTFATLLLQQGTDLMTIKSMLGHTRVTTTEIYAHIVDESKNKAANAIKINNLKSKRNGNRTDKSN